jgi:periplasmic divalent cation tolerance protein
MIDEMAEYVQIETTFKTEDDAKEMIQVLLNNSLIACAQWCAIKSAYNWEGKQHEESEVLLKVKTQAVLVTDCEKIIKQRHPYKLPQFTVTEYTASEEYGKWVDDSIKRRLT